MDCSLHESLSSPLDWKHMKTRTLCSPLGIWSHASAGCMACAVFISSGRQQSGLNNRMCSHSAGGRMSEIQVPGKGPRLACRQPPSHCVPTRPSMLGAQRGREHTVYGVPIHVDTNSSIMRAPPAQPHLNLLTSQRPISKPHHSGGWGFSIGVGVG